MIGEDGRMTAEAGDGFAGKTAAEAREAVVAALREQGRLLEGAELVRVALGKLQDATQELENDLVSTQNGTHELTAVLDKIAAGELLGRRQDALRGGGRVGAGAGRPDGPGLRAAGRGHERAP